MAWIAKFLSFETDVMVVSKPFNTKEEAEEWAYSVMIEPEPMTLHFEEVQDQVNIIMESL